MTNVQLYFAIGIPTLAMLFGILMNVLLYSRINARFNGVDGRFKSMDARFNSLDAKFDILTGKVIDVINRLTRIEGKLGMG